MKVCSNPKCIHKGKPQLESNFHKRKSSKKDGLTFRCKDCNNERNRKFNIKKYHTDENYRKRQNEISKKWSEDNPKKTKKYKKKYKKRRKQLLILMDKRAFLEKSLNIYNPLPLTGALKKDIQLITKRITLLEMIKGTKTKKIQAIYVNYYPKMKHPPKNPNRPPQNNTKNP